MHTTLKTIPAKLAEEDRMKWPHNTWKALLGIRTMVNELTGYTLARLLYDSIYRPPPIGSQYQLHQQNHQLILITIRRDNPMRVVLAVDRTVASNRKTLAHLDIHPLYKLLFILNVMDMENHVILGKIGYRVQDQHHK
jgi:hypothetical protein